jgi:tetratricopeptide (TPR) repeat protein
MRLLTLIACMFCIIFIQGIQNAYADDWPGATEKIYNSLDGRWQITISPGNSAGDLVGFEGSRKGEYAKALLKGPNGEKRFTLLNPIAPVIALVLDNGISVAFDNWHNMGYGKVVVAYSAKGEILWSKELEDLLDKTLVRDVPHTISSRWWRRSNEPLALNGDNTIVITLWNENKLEIDVADGNTKYIIIQDLGDDPKRLLQRARFMGSDPKGAIELLRKVIKLDPKNLPAWRLLGANLTQLKEHQAVVDTMKTAIDSIQPPDWQPLGHNDLEWTTYLYLFIIRSEAEKKLNDLAAAEVTLIKCIDLDSSFEFSLSALGRLLYEQGRGNEADKFLPYGYDALADRDRTKYFGFMVAKFLGDFYRRQGLHEKAKAYYLKGYSPDKMNNQYLYLYLAKSHEALGEYEDAIRVLKQILEWWQAQSNPSIWQRDIDRTKEDLTRLKEKTAVMK